MIAVEAGVLEEVDGEEVTEEEEEAAVVMGLYR